MAGLDQSKSTVDQNKACVKVLATTVDQKIALVSLLDIQDNVEL